MVALAYYSEEGVALSDFAGQRHSCRNGQWLRGEAPDTAPILARDLVNESAVMAV